MAQGPSGRVTAAAANGAFELVGALETLFRSDGVIDLVERKALRLAREVQRQTDTADSTLAVLLSGFHKDGIDSQTFRRRLREHDQDNEPDEAA